jgi:diketogulonate reductase-like aldo/keto reductase
MDEPLVHDIAARTGRNVGQVLIKWALQRRPNGSVLPKSVSESRIRGNAAVLDWELSAADVAALSALPSQCRMVHGGVFLSPAGPYRTLKDLWDEDE